MIESGEVAPIAEDVVEFIENVRDLCPGRDYKYKKKKHDDESVFLVKLNYVRQNNLNIKFSL